MIPITFKWFISWFQNIGRLWSHPVFICKDNNFTKKHLGLFSQPLSMPSPNLDYSVNFTR